MLHSNNMLSTQASNKNLWNHKNVLNANCDEDDWENRTIDKKIDGTACLFIYSVVDFGQTPTEGKSEFSEQTIMA
jgi:hypothetical protein